MRKHDYEQGISTYPVGLLADIKHGRIIASLKYVRRQARKGDWQAIKNWLNGYLAEWHYVPDGVVFHRCGTGWTRRRALRRLGRHLVEVNLSQAERDRGGRQ